MTVVFFKVALVALFAISAHGVTFGDLKVCENLSETDNRNVALLCKIKDEIVTFLKSENPNTDANVEVLNLIHSAKKLDHHKVSFLETLIKTLGGLAKAVDEIVKAKHYNSSRLKKGADNNDNDLGSGRLSEADLVSVHQALGMNIGG